MKRRTSLLLVACAALVAMPSLTPAQDETKPVLDGKIHERRVAYRDAMEEVVAVIRQRYLEGSDMIDGLIKAQIELGNAELAVTSAPEKRIQKLQENLDALKELETHQQGRIQIGAGRLDELHKSTAGRIRGEIMLLEEQERQSR